LDAVFLSVGPDGPREGVLVASGFSEDGERVPLAVMLGMCESHEDRLALARDLIARGLGPPLLIVADGAPGLTRAVERAGRAPIASTAPFTACATCSPSCPNAGASASAPRTGGHSMRRPASATAGSDCGRSSTSSIGPATPPRRSAGRRA